MNVTISDSVTKIEMSAFGECHWLQEVNYTGTEEQWNEIEIDYGNDYLQKARINYI